MVNVYVSFPVSISVDICHNSAKTRPESTNVWGYDPTFDHHPHVLKIAQHVTSQRYPGISQSASVFLSRDRVTSSGLGNLCIRSGIFRIYQSCGIMFTLSHGSVCNRFRTKCSIIIAVAHLRGYISLCGANRPMNTVKTGLKRPRFGEREVFS